MTYLGPHFLVCRQRKEKQTEIVCPSPSRQAAEREKNHVVRTRSFHEMATIHCLSYASGLMRHSHTNYHISVAFSTATDIFLGHAYTCSATSTKPHFSANFSRGRYQAVGDVDDEHKYVFFTPTQRNRITVSTRSISSIKYFHCVTSRRAFFGEEVAGPTICHIYLLYYLAVQ